MAFGAVAYSTSAARNAMAAVNGSARLHRCARCAYGIDRKDQAHLDAERVSVIKRNERPSVCAESQHAISLTAARAGAKSPSSFATATVFRSSRPARNHCRIATGHLRSPEVYAPSGMIPKRFRTLPTMSSLTTWSKSAASSVRPFDWDLSCLPTSEHPPQRPARFPSHPAHSPR